jgi:Flp pilus assembly protein TadD
MKLGSLLRIAGLCAVLLASSTRAAGPDDMYLDAYRLIQEADQISAAQPEQARQRYGQAQDFLKKIQNSYPEYSKAAVTFRLEYIGEKLKGLPASHEAQPAATQPRIAAPARPEDQLKALHEQIARLEADNSMLQAKLKEALAPQPASVDPREFARAEERIKSLEKEKELLRVSLEQGRAKQPEALDRAQLDQLRGELETARKQVVDNVASVAALNQENERLKQELSSPAKTPAAEPRLEQERAEWQKQRMDWEKQRAELETRLASATASPSAKEGSDSSKLKALEKERDAALKKLNEANKELYDVKARGQAAQFETLTNQLATLRARIEVFEARKVPYSAEELALLDKSGPKPSAVANNSAKSKGDAKPAKRAAREMPSGAAPLIAAAQASFAAHRIEDAEAKYEQVVKMDENNPDSLANLAAVQLQLDKFDKAETNVKKALSLDPEDPYALTLMGILRLRQNNYDEAFDVLSRSAQIDPKNPETENYLGLTLSYKGQREAAETALRKAIMLQPTYGAAHRNLAVIYASQKPPFLELARYHYSKSLAFGDTPSAELEKELNLMGK